MKKNLITFVRIAYTAARDLLQHDGMEHAGYLTFLGVLSLFPFLVLMVAAFGLVGQGQAGSDFIAMAIAHLPKEAVAALLPRIQEITSGPPQGLLTVAILGALWTSSSAVEGMRNVLNRAYRVAAPPHFFFRRVASMLQIIVFTILVILVMAVMVFAPIALQGFVDLTGMEVPLNITRLFTHFFVYIGAVILFVVVAGVYYVLPNIKQSLWAVLPGAALVVALWVLSAMGVTIYLTRLSSMSVIYGSLSSFIATLIFFYVMNVIFIYGAEFNHVLLEA
ncbi:MAG: hypothetical protein B7X02_00600, partial [Rhodospirillales bacterium 12-54-5]